MAINLNRGKPKKYSSSNRIGSLIGNGLLTFIDYKKKFNHFFNNNEIIFYHDHKDLSDKLSYYKKKNKEKKRENCSKWPKKYFRLFNEVEVADYILKRSFFKLININQFGKNL